MRRTICVVIWANFLSVISVNATHFPGPNCFLSKHQFTVYGLRVGANCEFPGLLPGHLPECAITSHPRAGRDGSRGLRPDMTGQTRDKGQFYFMEKWHF